MANTSVNACKCDFGAWPQLLPIEYKEQNIVAFVRFIELGMKAGRAADAARSLGSSVGRAGQKATAGQTTHVASVGGTAWLASSIDPRLCLS